jgi:response regulator RpfG family c-di-GMP phosphodiesterase
MSVQELKALARKHWEEWLPETVAELKREGRLNEELQAAANLAQDEIESLMEAGYSVHEAREVALPNFILLEPEGDGLEDWEREELAEKEAAYQRMMRAFLEEPEDDLPVR